MATPPPRKDAARNRQRILEIGRRHVDDGVPLQLNDIAKAASVGVATVYRHFPTPEALLETLAAPGLEALAARAEQAATQGDPWGAFSDFLLVAAEAQVTDRSIAAVMARQEHALPSTTALQRRLIGAFGELLAGVHAAGMVDPSVTRADIGPLMCGVAFAARVHTAGGTANPSATARRYLSILLDGLRAPGV